MTQQTDLNPKPKPFWKSKTVVINSLITIVAVALGAVDALTGLDWMKKYPEILGIALGLVPVLNVALRVLTNGPITVSTEKNLPTTPRSRGPGMMLLVIALITIPLFVISGNSVIHAQQPGDTSPTAVAPTTPSVATAATPLAIPSDAQVAKQLKLNAKQRRHLRRMGVTRLGIFSKAIKLKRAGELDGLSHRDAALKVYDELQKSNRKAFASADKVGLDIMLILAFIEKILPLILALFG